MNAMKKLDELERTLDEVYVEVKRAVEQWPAVDLVRALVLARIGDREMSVSRMEADAYRGTNVTYQLKIMENAGLVTVRQNPADQRSKVVRATQLGRKVGAAARQAILWALEIKDAA